MNAEAKYLRLEEETNTNAPSNTGAFLFTGRNGGRAPRGRPYDV